MVIKNKLRDAPFQVVHIYKDGRTIVESQHNAINVAIRMAHKYKREVPTNVYAVQQRVVYYAKRSLVDEWKTVKTI